MADRKSLLEDAGFDSIGRKGGGSAAASGGKKKNDQIKIIIAAVALALAGVLLAWNFGLLGGESLPETKRPAQPTAEEIKQFEEQQKINERLLQDPNVTQGGA